MVKLHLQAFWQNFEYGKMQKFVFCLQDLKKSSSPKLLNRILRYCTQIVHLYSNFYSFIRKNILFSLVLLGSQTAAELIRDYGQI